jgi:hypothetical protein
MYKTKWEKEKEKGKGFWLWWAGGETPAQPGAGARAREPAQHGPRARDGVGARGDGVGYGPTRQGEREASAQMGKGGEPAIPRGEPGRRWVQRRFSAGDPVPGERAGSIAREEAGMLKGGSNFARCDWEGVDHGGVAGLRGGSHRR